MKSIDVHELKAWRDEGKAHQLIDLREDFEVETGHLGGTHIRMGDILSRAKEIRRDVPVILQCRSGGRSAAVLTALEEKFGMDNLYNLDG
ncbi:MAG: rhodanese-like domain-containing protein, partial [Flavobacteriales bacterium]